MHPVIDVIMICHFSGQLDLDSFQSFALALCSCHSSITFPILPAISLHMGLITDTSVIFLVVQFDVDSFQTFTLASCSRCVSILNISLPAIGLYVSSIFDQRMSVTVICASRCSSIFFYQTDFNSFQSLRISGSSGKLSIFRPSHPAECLTVHSIIYVIMVCHFSGQFHLDGFQSFTLTLCTSHGSVFHPFLPSVGLHMRLITDATVILLIFQLDLNSFQPLTLPFCSGHFPVADKILPSVSLHMGTVRNLCFFCLYFNLFFCSLWSNRFFCHFRRFCCFYLFSFFRCCNFRFF